MSDTALSVYTDVPGQEVWVEPSDVNLFEIGVQASDGEFIYLELTRVELEALHENIESLLTEVI